MQPGDRVDGRYEIAGRAGAGGMGVVYRATDRATGRLVALKVLHPRRQRHRERFAREAALLAQLRHPTIATYFDHGLLETGELYLAMEWVDGRTLRDRLRDGPLELAERLGIHLPETAP